MHAGEYTCVHACMDMCAHRITASVLSPQTSQFKRASIHACVNACVNVCAHGFTASVLSPYTRQLKSANEIKNMRMELET